MDGIKNAYNFMRYPATWEQFSANVDTLKQNLPKSTINFAYVIQILNIGHVYKTIDWANKQLIPIQIRSLSNPNAQGLSWSILREHEVFLSTLLCFKTGKTVLELKALYFQFIVLCGHAGCFT
jgi:hypothetical protein